LNSLFAQRGCLGQGFTGFALEHLRQTKMIPRGAGLPFALGGAGLPNENTVTECLGRMVAWCRVVEEVCMTEFPDFELLNAFAVFRIRPASDPTFRDLGECVAVSAQRTAHVADQLKRLTDAFNIDDAGLVDQFEEHVRIAQTEMSMSPHEPAAEAWRRALQKTGANSRTRRSFPATALLPVLQRFVVAPGSTAGIEQNFSKLKRILGEHWNGSEHAEERRLVLALAAAASPDAGIDLLTASRLIWASTFAATRERKGGDNLPPKLASLRAQRLRNGAMRTAASWLRRRRQLVGEQAADNNNAADPAVDRAADSAWAAGHKKEVAFQRVARTERLHAAVQQGVIGIGALGPNAEAQMAEYRGKEKDRQHKHDARNVTLETARGPPPAFNLEGRNVFVDDDALVILRQTPEQWQLSMRKHRMLVAADRALASVFVVLNPSAMSDRVRCVASLVGGLVCTPEHILTSRGAALQLQRAMSWPRHIFLSDACYKKHRVIIDLLRRVCALAPTSPPKEICRWSWYLESDGDARRELFLSRSRKRGKTHATELVSMLAPDQIAMAAYSEFPNRKPLSTWLTAFCRANPLFTHRGYCGH
jgi:hypothetical protein